MGQKIAIVTTLRNADAVLASFLSYHFSVGFSHIFLFFDDPDDPSISTAQKFPNVTVVRHDDELKQKWEKTRSYLVRKDMHQFIYREVMARQTLNVDVAIELASEMGIDWLLHIDIDELFYLQGRSLDEHFQSLSNSGVRCVIYPNHEAIVERPDIRNYFKEVTLFKKNDYIFGRSALSDLQNEIREVVPQLPEKFFFFYREGKSAAKLSEGLMANGVHIFCWQHELEAALNGTLQASRIKTLVSDEAVILHYPCCGFEHFWKKYKSRGKFADRWFGQLDIQNRIGNFHLEARDIVSLGQEEEAREFYEKRFVMRDKAQIDWLIEKGLACHIKEPSLLISKLTA